MAAAENAGNSGDALPASVSVAILERLLGGDGAAELRVAADTVTVRLLFGADERGPWLEVVAPREGDRAVLAPSPTWPHVRFSDGRTLSTEDRGLVSRFLATLRYEELKAANGGGVPQADAVATGADAPWWASVEAALSEAQLAWEPDDPLPPWEESVEADLLGIVWFDDNWSPY